MLAWVGGLFAARHPLPALCAFALLLAGDWPRARVPARFVLLCLCYAAGWGVALAALPETPPTPAWVTGKPQRVTGIVDDVDGLPDGRLRIMLRDVHPVFPEGGASPVVTAGDEGDGSEAEGLPVDVAEGEDRADSRPARPTVAGVGNIYADESLFRAGIRPDTQAHTLTPERLFALHGHLQDVLRESIAECGSSIRDYRDAHGDAGAFQNSFRVYGRGGQPCRHCGTTLATAQVAGRTTVFCPQCQR